MYSPPISYYKLVFRDMTLAEAVTYDVNIEDVQFVLLYLHHHTSQDTIAFRTCIHALNFSYLCSRSIVRH